MRVTVAIEGDLREIMRDEVLRGEIAVTAAVHGATRRVRRNMQAQVRAAGLGGRLANSIRERLFPAGEPSLKAAGLAFSKAPKILDAFERGALIRSESGFWLAIPFPGVTMKGRRGGRITPAEYEQRTGRRLRLVYRKGRTALLVDDGTVLQGARTMGRDGFTKAARGFRNRTVPVFTLVPQVKLKKRLDFGPLAEREVAGLPGLIVANWR